MAKLKAAARFKAAARLAKMSVMFSMDTAGCSDEMDENDNDGDDGSGGDGDADTGEND